MTWFKVDDRLHSHPKVLAAIDRRPSAMGLWVVAGSWAADHLTDGVVTRRQVERLGFSVKDAHALVEAGLWEQESLAVYRFHDWSRFQPTKAEVEYKRSDLHQKRAAAGRAGGLASAAARKAKREAKTKQVASGSVEQEESPDPARPGPTRPQEKDPHVPQVLHHGEAFRVFSDERDKAGKGKYKGRLSDQEPAAGAISWALEEDPQQPLRALRWSIRAYLKLSGDWERDAGYPFKAWASDPGKWYALGQQHAKRAGNGGPPAPHERPEGERADPETVKKYVDQIRQDLGMRKP